MIKGKIWPALRILALCLAALMLVSCAGGSSGSEYFRGDQPILNEEYQRELQEVRLAAPGGQQVEAENNGRKSAIDLGNAKDGYVAVRAVADTRALCEIMKTDTGQSYLYALDTDGSWCFYPFSYGDGPYSIKVYLRIGETGTTYEEFQVLQENVAMADDKAPFLLPNRVVNYNADSAVIAQGRELVQHCETDLEVIRQVFWWITENISYDTEKAENIGSYDGVYVPDIDEILALGKGICYDYASMAAAMLRSNGVPTRLIMGDVNDGEGGTMYHAWNEVWTAETGWIAVRFEVQGGEWNRVDTTFAASRNTNIAKFIGDGTNYYDISVH